MMVEIIDTTDPAQIGKEYTFRPLGRLFQKVDMDDDDIDYATETEIEKHTRYFVNILDRADGKIKVLTGPLDAFRCFFTFWQIKNKEPGGKSGGDFHMLMHRPNFCEAHLLGDTPLTEEEIKTYSAKLIDLEPIARAGTDGYPEYNVRSYHREYVEAE